MTTYLLSIYQPDGPPPPGLDLTKVMRDVDAVIAEIKSSGAWAFNGGLFPPASATVVRAAAGKRTMTDGPFAETKEHLGGFVIVDSPDLDAALEWAGKLAQATTLPVEVRPFHGDIRRDHPRPDEKP